MLQTALRDSYTLIVVSRILPRDWIAALRPRASRWWFRTIAYVVKLANVCSKNLACVATSTLCEERKNIAFASTARRAKCQSLIVAVSYQLLAFKYQEGRFPQSLRSLGMTIYLFESTKRWQWMASNDNEWQSFVFAHWMTFNNKKQTCHLAVADCVCHYMPLRA